MMPKVKGVPCQLWARKMLLWTSSFATFMRLILIVDKLLQNATAFFQFKLFTVIYLGKLTIK